ncbi:hypothetical protein [Humisphaera borealis]|uniref:Uncharacterized protein n=1 Tax=Humisphaera borealis TaxID=2807512 RepID=A0A7M2X2X2_9BACT|nr:hypothetical protein [Humisphaera borealis]QOV92108.1 hypothetical protein IPV69_12435 [Humisphaera borealis]
MAERRTLVEGLTPAATPTEQQFMSAAKSSNGYEALRKATTDASGASLSTRIRPDFVALLKRASLERKLDGIEPNSLRDILEDAIEPWLKAHGYMN